MWFFVLGVEEAGSVSQNCDTVIGKTEVGTDYLDPESWLSQLKTRAVIRSKESQPEKHLFSTSNLWVLLCLNVSIRNLQVKVIKLHVLSTNTKFDQELKNLISCVCQHS